MRNQGQMNDFYPSGVPGGIQHPPHGSDLQRGSPEERDNISRAQTDMIGFLYSQKERYDTDNSVEYLPWDHIV